MENYKIKVTTEAESEEAQELFFELGYKWARHGATYINIMDYEFITAYLNEMKLRMGFGHNSEKELTLPQLRDLVVLHRNDVKDATHTDQDNWQWFISSSGIGYVFGCGNSQNLPRWDESSLDMVDLIPIEKQIIKAPEQGLISGADALRALADGKEVEYFSNADYTWKSIFKYHPSLEIIATKELDINHKFRLKPRTITLNIEIPACGLNHKHGQLIWILNSLEPDEYCSVILDESDNLPAYWWASEEEIKQVVSALRKGFKL